MNIGLILLQVKPTFDTFATHAKVIDKSLIAVIGITSTLALALAGVFFLLIVGYSYVKSSIRLISDPTPGKLLDVNELARILLMGGLIALYIPIVTMGMGIVEMADEFTNPTFKNSPEIQTAMDKYLDAYYYEDDLTLACRKVMANPNNKAQVKVVARRLLSQRKLQLKGEDQASQDLATEAMITNTIVQPQNPWFMMKIVSAVFTAIGMIIANLAMAIANFGVKVLIALGPLAFAFSIIPAFRNQVVTWASATLGMAFTIITINIITWIDKIYFLNITFDPGDFSNSATYNIAKVVVYCMPFWFTSKYVGRGEGAAFVGKAMGMAVAATAALLSGGASAGASGGGGALGTIVKTGQKGTEKE